MNTSIVIGPDVIAVRPDSTHEYVIDTAAVAKGYGVSPAVTRIRRTGAEIEGHRLRLSQLARMRDFELRTLTNAIEQARRIHAENRSAIESLGSPDPSQIPPALIEAERLRKTINKELSHEEHQRSTERAGEPLLPV